MSAARLLIVDDEAPLLDLLQRYLGRLGYEVETAASPRAALERFEKDPQRYAFVLTDLSLLEMSGEELISKMRARNPHLPAVISSGYPFEPQLKGVHFLQKPYLPKMLAELIEKLIGPAPAL